MQAPQAECGLEHLQTLIDRVDADVGDVFVVVERGAGGAASYCVLKEHLKTQRRRLVLAGTSRACR